MINTPQNTPSECVSSHDASAPPLSAVSQTPDINAMLVGCVSSGKSSFLNGLVGNIVAPASKDRQTFRPIQFHLSKNGKFVNTYEISKQINAQKSENEKLFKSGDIRESEISTIDKIYSETLLPAKNNLYITDFAG